MAPITTTVLGIIPQIVDDDRLTELQRAIAAIPWEDSSIGTSTSTATETKVDPEHKEEGGVACALGGGGIDALVELLVPHSKWNFEEQVDLQEWIPQLNRIDAALTFYLQRYPSMLLVEPVLRMNSKGVVLVNNKNKFPSRPAESMQEVQAVPSFVTQHVCILLRFLSGILANCSSKAVFHSHEELVDLLGAADDEVASLALEALSHLSAPPALHKQQAPELAQHQTMLHVSRTSSHKRLMTLAKGWGTRGSGLGLFSCATADDSEFGQGSLPSQAGELSFHFYPPSKAERRAMMDNNSSLDDEDTNMAGGSTVSETDEPDSAHLVQIQLSAKEIVLLDNGTPKAVAGNSGSNSNNNNDESDDSTSQKRRKVAPESLGGKTIRSTAELLFLCFEKAGGRQCIPKDRLFALLADIRLTRAFHSRPTRVAAIQRRLQALISILYVHPNQEIMSGYFHAQPELCVELTDLLRPTVSTASVSSSISSASKSDSKSSLQQGSVASLAESPSNVPYRVRTLALETITALVARRDGANGSLTGVARHSNVLNELGVGKGQYLGLLPTLIRYSLASLGSLVSDASSSTAEPSNLKSQDTPSSTSDSLSIGLAFVEAATPTPMPKAMQLERALEFIDVVLTLASAVISTPSGTSALTDSGLIPALLTTAAMDSEVLSNRWLEKDGTLDEAFRIKALCRFITAQAIQILEGAIVTHNSALSAFHDLNGVEMLTSKLSQEILKSKQEDTLSAGADSSSQAAIPMEVEASGPMPMDIDTEDSGSLKLQSSQRVLLFSLVTCLTVVFHQESTSSSVTTPSGAAELRKPELTRALKQILQQVEVYGGHLVSLISTLLSDVMNSDPHIVHHIHESGLAKSYLNMLSHEKDGEPSVPAVPELIMSIPSVLSALSLTEAGAKAIKAKNPFPSLLRLLHHPKYAMPQSRCLLNELTAIIGTGLDEIMRHNQSLRPLALTAIAAAMNKVADFGQQLARSERSYQWPKPAVGQPVLNIETDRSCLMQYVLNFTQLLEQILHNDDHCEPFVDAGGLDALLRLYPCLLPTGHQFLSHLSSLSCPSVSTLAHSTTEDSLTLVFKCIALRYDSFKLLQKMINAVSEHLVELEDCQEDLRKCFESDQSLSFERLDASYILEGLPRQPLFDVISQDTASSSSIDLLSIYLRKVVGFQWMTSLLASVIKAACQRGQESGSGWSRDERQWKKELSSTAFEELLGRINKFHRTALYEVCRIRTEPGYEERELKRVTKSTSKRLRFRLRIVCTEGAVVRDGIEIDSCASVGSMEMGEITDAFDRCVNSSGILRYRTSRGWLSEQTRGHGREPISEVLSVWESDEDSPLPVADAEQHKDKNTIEPSSVLDLCTASACVLARVQTGYAEMSAALTRVVVQGIRSLPIRNLSFQQGTIGNNVCTVLRILTKEVQKGFDTAGIVDVVKTRGAASENPARSTCVALYLSSLLSHLQSCLFEEKRDRRLINVPLLISLTNSQVSISAQEDSGSSIGLFDACRFVLIQGLSDFESRSSLQHKNVETSLPRLELDRTTAASLPPVLTFFRRLLSGPSITSSPISSVLSRVKLSELSVLVGERDVNDSPAATTALFSPEEFSRTLHSALSETLLEVWTDPRIVHSPPQILHPVSTLVSQVINALEETTKKTKPTPNGNGATARGGEQVWNPFRHSIANLAGQGRVSGLAAANRDFEPSEEAIVRLTEMGFSRDHAIDALESTGTNQLELAMEYALSNPPPTAEDIERRRAERESRRQRRQAAEAVARRVEGGASSANADDDAAAENQAQNSGEGQNRSEENASMGDGESQQGENSAQENTVDESIKKVSGLISKWKVEGPKVSCNILSAISSLEDTSAMETMRQAVVSNPDGDARNEATTVILSSFLLDVCRRYPDERGAIVEQLIEKMKEQLSEGSSEQESAQFAVSPGREAGFASLCHATLLVLRAIPMERKIVLKHNMVKVLVSISVGFVKGPLAESPTSLTESFDWPAWLAPCLLLLDVMSQPVVAFSKKSEVQEEDASSELTVVQSEHMSQATSLVTIADSIFSALNKSSRSRRTEQKDIAASAGADMAMEHESSKDEKDKKKEENVNLFQDVPAYYPLIPADEVSSCVEVCLSIIGKCPSKPSPGIVHACLLLLMRLMRNPSVSMDCLKAGLAEKLLSMPDSCRFIGHSGLATLVLRRLIEDETTLVQEMEAEIRATLTKLSGKSRTGDGDRPSVSRKRFIQAMSPLLCREPTAFVKAIAVSVRFEKGSASDGNVVLISQSERSRNSKVLAGLFHANNASTPSKSAPAKKSSSAGKQRSRSKTPSRGSRRNSAGKKGKKEKNEECDFNVKGAANTSPASHVTALLIGMIIDQGNTKSLDQHRASDFGHSISFLWLPNLLEILADLVISVPACASSIHKYRPTRNKVTGVRSSQIPSIQHCLSMHASPARNFSSFLLHCLLPQDRWSIKKELRAVMRANPQNTDATKAVKLAGSRRVQLAQASARVLVSLAARPGEGRKRIIGDLTFAISDGRLGCASSRDVEQDGDVKFHTKQLHALHAWGELCTGLASPRSNGNISDGNTSSLSIEVVRIMLEMGMAHALLLPLHRIPLHHPMASSTCSALLVPFEILSRPIVGDTIKGLVEKEANAKAAVKEGSIKADVQENDEHQMVEEVFEVEQPAANELESFDRAIADIEDAMGSDQEEGGMEVDGEDDAEDDDEEEDDEEDSESESSSVDDHSERSSDMDGSEGEDEDDDEDDDSGDDQDDDGASILEESEDMLSEEEDIEEEALLNDPAGQDDEMWDDGLDAPPENAQFVDENVPAVQDGWTRVENGALDAFPVQGMMMGGRRVPGLGVPLNNRSRGFVDAAEAMIGTLLRNGELNGNALAQLQGGPVGIRVVAGGRQGVVATRMDDPRGLAGALSGLAAARGNAAGSIGPLPHIHQRAQPDMGYSSFNVNGRWVEMSPMEYIYGGPAMTSGSRNYDIVSPVEVPVLEDETPPQAQFVDSPLFPSGQALTAHSRNQQASHPLLRGIDLPPLNALVSDLEPHGVRARRRAQTSARRPGEWANTALFSGGVLVSTSNGTVVRTSRQPGTGNFGTSMMNSANSGWTDGDVPLEATIGNFASAFEAALGDALLTTSDTSPTDNRATDTNDSGARARSPVEAPPAPDVEMEEPAGDPQGDTQAAQVGGSQEEEHQENDGDGVASSLAEGLRLSPRNESTAAESGSSNAEQPEPGPNEPPSNASETNDQEGHEPEEATANAPEEAEDTTEATAAQAAAGTNANGLVCPPGMDLEVFNSLPLEMQQEVVEQARAEGELAAQLDAGSSLDPEVLAALPEDMRQEAIEQERRERRLREAPADPAHAEEMDNASFVASLAPDLRREILLTADDAFLQSLPPNIAAEAQILRERATMDRRVLEEQVPEVNRGVSERGSVSRGDGRSRGGHGNRNQEASSSRRKQRTGKLRVEKEKDSVVFLPPGGPVALTPPIAKVDIKTILRLMYLLSPIRPNRLVQRVMFNLCSQSSIRHILSAVFVKLLHDDKKGALESIDSLEYLNGKEWRDSLDKEFGVLFSNFPPDLLIGAAPEVLDSEHLTPSIAFMRQKQTNDTAASIAENLPMTSRGSGGDQFLPPVVAARFIDTLQNLCKNSPRFSLDVIVEKLGHGESSDDPSVTCFESLIDLLRKPSYSKSSANLEQLLLLLESAVSPLSQLSKHGDEELEVSKKDIDAASAAGKEWVDVPRIVVSQQRLQLLCSILRMETCRDSAFTKVNTIARRLCRIEANRGYVLAELASVADSLGADAVRDLKSLRVRMSDAAAQTNLLEQGRDVNMGPQAEGFSKSKGSASASASNSVTISTSTSELKLLRVLQTLQSLCADNSEDAKKSEGAVMVTTEMVHLLRAMKLENLWDELTSCLKVVQVLEGVTNSDEEDEKKSDEGDADGEEGKKLQNSVAGLLSRFLPSIESFFIANGSATLSKEEDPDTKNEESPKPSDEKILVGGDRLVQFVTANRIIINALVRSNAGLLDKGLKILVQYPPCRHLMDFDVKRHWFKVQVRRLRQQASRRHGSLRLHIRRRNVFEDAYHQLRLRNAEEMRGRLHITFRNEEGVDAGGLSREFFGILAKEMFNPNYALFTSTEDGSTFQPNPNSNINPDHLSYFRFVGRIVGKALADGYLLDAHFTRSLYKHMLGIKPTHHDMEAIDPDYYKNLKTILEYNLGDLGLDLTFSIEDHSFGRSQNIDLIPNGRNTPVTEENKARYVSLVCQHRMTNSISSQIKAYLDGFYEMVSPELIALFTPRELELLISGLPDIDVSDLKMNTDYVGWKATDKQIQWFWNVLSALSRNEKAAFLQFVTGSSKVPLAGFGELPGMRGVQKFSIHKAGGTNGALMSAHTCFNSLDLPVYSSEEELREKLLYAINEGAGGFGFA